MCSSGYNRDITADFFGVPDSELPAIGVHDSETDASYLLRGKEFTVSQIESFLQGIANGTAVSNFRSSEL